MFEAPTQNVVDLYSSGLSSGKISKIINKSPARVLQILRKAGVGRRTSAESLRQVDDDEILALFRSGYIPSRIGEILHRSVTTITSSLKRSIGYNFDPIIYPVDFNL